jgi:signal transduction histidine kinase
MRPSSSLFRRLVGPVVGLVLAAVVANVSCAAWLAVRRTATAAVSSQHQLQTTLRAARIPFTTPILDTLRQLTGCHFVVVDSQSGALTASTLETEHQQVIDWRKLQSREQAADDADRTVVLGGARYRVGTIRSSSVRPETAIVLTPVPSRLEAILEAVWPTLLVAAATLAVLLPIGWRTTISLARRLSAIERQVARIAAGEFGSQLLPTEQQPADEVTGLVGGVNRMSHQLAELRDSLQAGERQRLLGQIAAGFAHELRNAVTGAQLALDLHRRRCSLGQSDCFGPTRDDSLMVAKQQLDILEDEVRGLLALGKPGELPPPARIAMAALLDAIASLVRLRCEHAGVGFEVLAVDDGLSFTGRRDAVRAAVVNLVLNAIHAAGRGGSVTLSAAREARHMVLTVEDTGPGPPAALAHVLTEPFVSGRSEGNGLGLAVARAVAESHDGWLSWERHGGRTRFALHLPITPLTGAVASASSSLTPPTPQPLRSLHEPHSDCR